MKCVVRIGINGFWKVIIENQCGFCRFLNYAPEESNCHTRDPKSIVVLNETFGDSLERSPEEEVCPTGCTPYKRGGDIRGSISINTGKKREPDQVYRKIWPRVMRT